MRDNEMGRAYLQYPGGNEVTIGNFTRAEFRDWAEACGDDYPTATLCWDKLPG